EAGYVAAPEKTYKSQLDDLKAFIDKNQKSDDKKSDDKKSERQKIIRRNFKCVLKHDFDGESLFRVQSLIYRDADFDIQLVYKLINLK
ncbi:TPA: thioredoxine reductase, partial [Staphylococcus aureus]|nr:thioredoxine reductase [Staphylococcus aureus]